MITEQIQSNTDLSVIRNLCLNTEHHVLWNYDSNSRLEYTHTNAQNNKQTVSMIKSIVSVYSYFVAKSALPSLQKDCSFMCSIKTNWTKLCL